MAKSRLIGSYPVIGIRPTIDGRRGPLKVRESLEVQTMNMAKNAAELISKNVFYSNGEPVKVVIADTTIGRVAEAAACADKFKKEGVDITLTVTPCWCYGSETMDMDPMTIKAVWGFNGTERPGAVYLAAVLAGHAQKGLEGALVVCVKLFFGYVVVVNGGPQEIGITIIRVINHNRLPLLFTSHVIDVGQAPASIERICFNARHTVRDHYRSQACATIERIHFNGRHTVRDHN